MILQTPLSVGTCNVRWDNPGDGEHRWDCGVTSDGSPARRSPDLLGLQDRCRISSIIC